MNIVVVGLTHKTAPVEVREKLSIPEHQIEEALAHLKGYPHIEEVTIISTCNRLEIYTVVKETEQGITEIIQFLAEKAHVSLYALRKHLFTLLHEDALRHLMRVSSGLESLVLGEAQILAQVKNTHKLGQKYNGLGRLLDRLFKQAISTGKRVRHETSIGKGAVSISSAAIELAQIKADNLPSCRTVIIGAGKMACLLVKHLLSKGATDIAIVNRSHRRARELADKFPQAELKIYPLSEMINAIECSDIVFTSTGATEPILNKDKLERNISSDKNLMLIDISVPRNIAADVNEIEHIQVYNVDDLQAVVAANKETRRRIAREAEGIIEEEVNSYTSWWQSLEAVPTIVSLRSKVEEIREQELDKALSRLGSGFGAKQQKVIDSLTKSIVGKILHEPMEQLKSQEDVETRRRCLESLQMLFNLEMEESA